MGANMDTVASAPNDLTMDDVMGWTLECGHQYRDVRFYGRPCEGVACRVCGQIYPFGTPLSAAKDA